MPDDAGRKRDDARAYVQTTPAEHDLAHGETHGMSGDEIRQVTAEIPAGTRLGRFVVRGQLGAGGMGVVFAGEDVELARPVAIKVVRGDVDQPAYRDRLLREAQAMARLEHPHVVRVYEVGTDRGKLFVAMEFVDGVTLTKWLAATPRPWREILAMFGQVGAGLAAVHKSGLVHRDFKPDNVLVDRSDHARVADFGLARVEDNSMPPLTRTGLVMGTPGYMAPEQQWGSDVDARADQYSFCVALREATKKAADLPRPIRAAIVRGLSYDPAERFASMTELLAALEEPRRSRTWALVGLAAVLVAGAAVATIVIVGERVRTETSTQVVAAPPLLVPSPPIVVANDDGSQTPMAMAPKPLPPPAPIPPAPVPPAPAPAPAAAPKPTGLGWSVAPGQEKAPAPQLAATTPKPAVPATKAPIVRHEIIAKDRVPVRVAVHDLGYGGLTFVGDPSNDEQLARDQIAAQGPEDHLQRAALIYSLGAVQRKKGQCDTAIATWQSAFDPLHKANEANRTDNLVWRFWTRTKFAIALCMLEEGRGIEAWTLLDKDVRQTSFGFPEDEQAAFHFVAGMTGWETGDPEAAHEIRLGIGSHASKALEQAVRNWAANVGL